MIKLQGKSRIINYDENLVLLRPNGTDYVDGKPVQREPTRIEFKANVQPLNGRDLLIVPEGDRFKEMYFVWSDFEIKINDQIVRQDINFQVQQSEMWGSYSRARMVRIDVGPDANP